MNDFKVSEVVECCDWARLQEIYCTVFCHCKFNVSWSAKELFHDDTESCQLENSFISQAKFVSIFFASFNIFN